MGDSIRHNGVMIPLKRLFVKERLQGLSIFGVEDAR